MPIVQPHLDYEMMFKTEGYLPVAGLDEAGRGAWAGPVAAGAVILPIDQADLPEQLKGVRDSKTCTHLQRDRLYDVIFQVAISAAVGMASADEIDEIGVVPATRLAMRRAVEQLSPDPHSLLIDYIHLHEVNLPQRSIKRGDNHSFSIAAASIIAKVSRDRLMIEMGEIYPGYGFGQHKGYGTRQHQAALAKLKPCPIHRQSFSPVRTRLIDVESVS